eukprot:SAG31_NODE_3706_length_3971_cov_7.584969_3_plen_279_part_00
MMVEQCKPTQMGLSADGTQMISLRSGTVYWDAATRPDGLTYGTGNETTGSAAAALITLADAFITNSEPWSNLLPTVIFDCIDADPTAPLAKRFRLCARHTLVPGLQRVSGLLEAHSAVVEVPPTEWCDLLFAVGLWKFGLWSLFARVPFDVFFGSGAAQQLKPDVLLRLLLRRLKARYPTAGRMWNLLSPSSFQEAWVGYTRSFEEVIAEWDSGELGTVLPRGHSRLPWDGLRALNDWSIKRGETRQRELVGMTVEVEIPKEAWGDRMLSVKTGEEAL